MPELVKIRSELFPRLYDAFLRDDDPLSDEQDWRNVFDYQWERDEDYTGYALLERDRVAGMMAMAFSNRLIDGVPRKFCNLHTWWVHEDFRGHSVAMLRPLLSLKDCTVTHFTPCDRIRALTKRLGFVDLDLQMKVLLPAFGRGSRNGDVRLDFDDEMDPAVLKPHERTIHCDHLPYRVNSLVVREGERHCYVLYTVVERYRVRYCHIHFIGDRDLFAQHEPLVRSAIMGRHGVWFVMLDARLVRGMNFDLSFDFWAPAHGVFRPESHVNADQVDNLYSDVVMLRLAVMPYVTYELEKLARRHVPGARLAPA